MALLSAGQSAIIPPHKCCIGGQSMFTKKMKEVFYYARAFVVWVIFSAAVGAVCGLVGGAFAITVEEVTHLRQHVSWLPWLMPAAGLLIAGLYKLLKLPLSISASLSATEGSLFVLVSASFSTSMALS